ncbi:hypothetical protein GQ42DRAFT_70035 [Ramicandelaber brevisporus]|nr:hypothetical protein GQ42DRAFT_70035 [Ramicandelaber brevisporus]
MELALPPWLLLCYSFGVWVSLRVANRRRLPLWRVRGIALAHYGGLLVLHLPDAVLVAVFVALVALVGGAVATDAELRRRLLRGTVNWVSTRCVEQRVTVPSDRAFALSSEPALDSQPRSNVELTSEQATEPDSHLQPTADRVPNRVPDPATLSSFDAVPFSKLDADSSLPSEPAIKPSFSISTNAVSVPTQNTQSHTAGAEHRHQNRHMPAASGHRIYLEHNLYKTSAKPVTFYLDRQGLSLENLAAAAPGEVLWLDDGPGRRFFYTVSDTLHRKVIKQKAALLARERAKNSAAVPPAASHTPQPAHPEYWPMSDAPFPPLMQPRLHLVNHRRNIKR